ncbi:hypothetical protein MK514_06825 [Streptococcus gordonii]|uniref:hypothetical protein n=1 Tax=Streptococcus gordonii TaxID=1302 RepID=UPI001CBEBDC7|nr:hypothetical protein [Streptococcus gordonii]MBZ2135725.1 hypothetical protein [Streptococcus gordonii]MCY7131098.1 hypothetical protein [Streptococcus gordonii]MCY7141349.1 hypothetical protein [Streptococcus gordonii]
MIQIEKLDPVYVRDWCESIYAQMNFPQKYRGEETFKKDISKWIREYLVIEGINWSTGDDVLLELMQLEYEDLCKIFKWFLNARKIDRKDRIFHPRYKGLDYLPKFESFLVSSYNFITKEIRYSRVKNSSFIVCPYCNRNFINSTMKVYKCEACHDNSADIFEYFSDEIYLKRECPEGHEINEKHIELLNSCQLDHFWSKIDYPLLSVCFYNLVPCCASCNLKKLTSEFSISPYDSSIEVDELFRFNYDLKSIHQPRIFIERQKSEKFDLLKKDLDNIGIIELYQVHSDVIEELLWKKEYYSKPYKERIKSLFQENGMKELTESEIKRFLTGVYTDSKEYGKRPLSKMVADISRNIGLIGE